jgi:hypothetical protein
VKVSLLEDEVFFVVRVVESKTAAEARPNEVIKEGLMMKKY